VVPVLSSFGISRHRENRDVSEFWEILVKKVEIGVNSIFLMRENRDKIKIYAKDVQFHH
jgi:hypothetical protein